MRRCVIFIRAWYLAGATLLSRCIHCWVQRELSVVRAICSIAGTGSNVRLQQCIASLCIVGQGTLFSLLSPSEKTESRWFPGLITHKHVVFFIAARYFNLQIHNPKTCKRSLWPLPYAFNKIKWYGLWKHWEPSWKSTGSRITFYVPFHFLCSSFVVLSKVDQSYMQTNEKHWTLSLPVILEHVKKKTSISKIFSLQK